VYEYLYRYYDISTVKLKGPNLFLFDDENLISSNLNQRGLIYQAHLHSQCLYLLSHRTKSWKGFPRILDRDMQWALPAVAWLFDSKTLTFLGKLRVVKITHCDSNHGHKLETSQECREQSYEEFLSVFLLNHN
jgi:hypothetical protein